MKDKTEDYNKHILAIFDGTQQQVLLCITGNDPPTLISNSNPWVIPIVLFWRENSTFLYFWDTMGHTNNRIRLKKSKISSAILTHLLYGNTNKFTFLGQIAASCLILVVCEFRGPLTVFSQWHGWLNYGQRNSSETATVATLEQHGGYSEKRFFLHVNSLSFSPQ